MPVKAVTFDAYGTLLRNEDLMLIPRRMFADHGLPVRPEDVYRCWVDLYNEATQSSPFRTLRSIQGQVFAHMLYPETLEVLHALGHVRSAIVSNADQEHLAAWNFTFPVQFILISETSYR